uniref:hypothetical protein n=1 Tax=uncultured Allobacillus sp. TaxID=1638025 RepID=UPI002593149F|nr:hypothetical protein [uncultured Allobacillus sp.]
MAKKIIVNRINQTMKNIVENNNDSKHYEELQHYLFLLSDIEKRGRKDVRNNRSRFRFTSSR